MRLNKFFERLISFLVSVAIVLTLYCAPVTKQNIVYAMTNDQITAAITALQSRYPSGSYWNHEYGHQYDGSSVTYTPCPNDNPNNGRCNNLYGGSQCYAFARQIANDVFGSYPALNVANDSVKTGTVSNGWTAIKEASKVTLEPGDIIRSDYNSHTAIIWKIEGQNVYVAQCWGTSGCKISWGAFWGSSKKATVSELLGNGFNGVWKHPGGGKIDTYLSITGYDPLPSGTLTQGKSYPVKGIVSGYPNINHVWGGVYYRNGDKTDQYCDVNPDSTFYDLSTYFDANIIFNNLPVGYYTYKIEATTTDGQYAEIHSDFQIGEPPPPISYYEVRLDASGGEVSPGSITVQTDGTYNGLPTPGRYGYDFIGWFDDSGRQVWDGVGIYTNSDHTLYARWNPKSITVYLNANGGLISPDTIQVSFNNNYNNLPDPVRDGYNFVGWFTTADGGTQVDFNSVCNTVNEHTLFAHWDKNKIMISFNAMGGTVETANKLVVYDNKYGVLPTPQKKGYEFKGWYLEESCINQITSSSIVNITGNQSIYAKWELKKYRITFDANGGEVDISSKQVTAEKKYGVLPEPTKSYYRFLGWYTADDTKIISSDTVELSEDTTLYAKWILIGDVNNDGDVNVADAVRLQKYLLARITLTETDGMAADIYSDGVIDAFDMVFMRKLLIER